MIVQTIAVSGQNQSLEFSHHKEVCSHDNDVATSGCNCSIPFFPPAVVLRTPQLEWLMDPGLLPGHVYFLTLVDAKYRAICLAVSALYWGRGSNPLAFILPVQVACSHFSMQFSMQAV